MKKPSASASPVNLAHNLLTLHPFPPLTHSQVIEVVLPTYIMAPGENEKFYPSEVKRIAEKILKQEIDSKVDEKMMEDWLDDGEDFEGMSKSIANLIKNEVKNTLNIQRYKVVVQVTIGQRKDQGVRITSRCLWDTTTDNYASISYKVRLVDW